MKKQLKIQAFLYNICVQFFLHRNIAEPRKHWLLEDNSNANDADGGFINRHGPFQSSLNEGKNKRAKKPGILRGIGHMFRFGKHRKDGIVPTESISEMGSNSETSPSTSIQKETQNQKGSNLHALSESRQRNGPPNYQPPPPVALGVPVTANGIHHNDLFNHRYSHYVNYEELQQQIRYDRTYF